MHKHYSSFEKKIYSYCDENRGGTALLPVFVNLWDEKYKISKKDLTVIASHIVYELTKRNILLEIPKPNRFHVPYGLYEITHYEKDLVKKDDLAQKRTKLFK